MESKEIVYHGKMLASRSNSRNECSKNV